MQRIRFTGRVFPVAHTLSVGLHSLRIADSQFATDITIEITNNVVAVTVDVENYEPSMLGEICRRAIRTSKASIDLVSFSTGKGLTLVLETMTLPDGKTGPPSFDFSSAPTLCTAYTMQTLSQILPVALEQDVSMALSDLTETITQPDRVPINCGRAVETVRALVDPNPDRDIAWETLRNRLNLSKPYLKLITDNSKSHRHGNYAEVDNETGRNIRDRAWTIMNRFLEYRKRNSQSLPTAEFSILN